MTHEDFVTFEQAKALKGFGFNSKCMYWYHPEDPFNIIESVVCCNHNDFNRPYSAPTLAQAQKWLREVRGLCICSMCKIDNRRRYKYQWMITFLDENKSDSSADIFFDSYEKALSAGIDKAIEILKQQ